MTCNHCGKTYDDEFSYCPYCAEPKPETVVQQTIEDKIKEKNKTIWLKALLVFAVMFPISFVFVYIVNIIVNLFTPIPDGVDMYRDSEYLALSLIPNTSTVVWISLGLAALWSVILLLDWFLKNHHKKMIDIQFQENQASICPECGSHNVSLGRKGYDWNKAFWGTMFNVKGSRYVAGADSRRVTAHCNHCGHDWETNRVWNK